MLFFEKQDISIKNDNKSVCEICKKRRSMWVYRKKNVCAWCILYSGKCQWGIDRKHEILDIGRAAQEHAVKHNKTLPIIDDRGRLSFGDAEKFLLGVMFTSKLLQKTGRFHG